MNDMTRIPDCLSLIYADDMKLFLPIDFIVDCAHLQRNVDNFVRWCQQNKFTLNPKKFNVMSFYNSSFTDFVYNINCIALTRVSHEKDLGVSFDRQLNLKLHIQNIVSEANRKLGFVIRLGRSIK